MLKPCRGCGRPSSSAICKTCDQARERARPSRASRGYDAAYEAARRDLLATFVPCETLCVICKLVIRTREEWSCEHIVPIRSGGTSELPNLGHAHKACNYAWRRQDER